MLIFLTVGIDNVANSINSIDMEDVKFGTFNFETPQLGRFENAYDALVSVLEKRKSSSKRPRKPQTPPNQTTIPANPKFSGSSTESKGEPFVQKFADRFTDSSLGAVRSWLDNFSWIHNKYKVRLISQYIS